MLNINTTSKYIEFKSDIKSDLYPLNEISYTVENDSETVSFYNRFFNKIITELIHNIQVNDVPVTRDNIQDLLSVLFVTNEAGGGSVDLSNYYTKPETNTLLDNKVDKVDGKQLSTEDYTTEEKTKLEYLHNYDDTIVKADIAANTVVIETEITRAKAAEKVNADAISTLDAAYKAADATLNTKIDAKVDKIDGKQLSTEDYTTVEKEKLASLSNYDDTTVKGDIAANTVAIASEVTRAKDAETALNSKIDTKVDKVDGKQLSTEDYTTAEKTKLAGLENYDDNELRALIETKADKDKYEKLVPSGGGIGTTSFYMKRQIKYQYIDVAECDNEVRINMPSLNDNNIDELHLLMDGITGKSFVFVTNMVWKEIPTEITNGALYEFIFTWVKSLNNWYAGYIKYE